MKGHADIEKELRSTLEDMLEDRAQKAGRPADEAMEIELLKEYGSPDQVAETYNPHPFLIGPRLFPIFEMVVKIVFAVVAGASLIGLVINLSQSGLTGPEFISALGKWFGGLFTGLISAFGNIVLVVAIIERTKAADEFEKEVRDWDPTDLQREPDPVQIDMGDHIATLIFTTLALVILNLYPDLLSLRYLNDGTWIVLPVLTPTFFSFLPWINLMGLLQIVYSSFMLGQKYWTPWTRILDILLDLAGMVLAIVILRTPGIFALTPEALSEFMGMEAADALARLYTFVPTLIITIIVVVTAINVVKHLIKLFSGKSRSTYPVAR